MLLGIGDAYAGQAHNVRIAPGLPPAIRERLETMYQDKAAQAYQKVITRYPMAPHVEDARDRLVAMNRPVPEPTEAAIAESDSEERSRQPLRFTDRTFDIIKHGPMTVQSVRVGDPTLDDPKRVLAPDITKQNCSRRPSTPASLLRRPRPLRRPVSMSPRAAINPLPLRCRCRRRVKAPGLACKLSARPTARLGRRPIPMRW